MCYPCRRSELSPMFPVAHPKGRVRGEGSLDVSFPPHPTPLPDGERENAAASPEFVVDRRNHMNLLSINSHVACGHVGNAAAVFALQRLGCEVWPVHTVLFSNHPGHGSFRGEAVEASTVRKLVRGIEERGLFPSCDGVLSGYVGKPETGEAILEAAVKVKAANPAA